MEDSYFELCEEIWNSTFDGSLLHAMSDLVRKKFDHEFTLEPYLIFGSPSEDFTSYLHLLLANPGKGLPAQRIDTMGKKFPTKTRYRDVALRWPPLMNRTSRPNVI